MGTRGVEATAEQWERLGESIRERLRILGIEIAEWRERSGINPNTLRGLRDGAPAYPPRPTTLRSASLGLGWSPDSLERILEGGEPVEIQIYDMTKLADIAELVVRVEGRVQSLKHLLDSLAVRLEIVESEVQQLQRPR